MTHEPKSGASGYRGGPKLKVLFAVLLLSIHPAAYGAAPPNILWIVAEDMSPDMGCYSDAYAQTPHLDALAAQGARFTRAFSISGVCAPSRSALITGMYPTTIGTLHMRSMGVPPPFVKCFTEYLRAAGYYTSNNAKCDYNFGHSSTQSIQTGISRPPLGAWDASGRNAHWRGRKEGQPFFAVFNLGVTHESRIRSSNSQFFKSTGRLRPQDRHDPNRALLPPYYPDAPAVRQDWARYHDLITAMDLQAEDLLQQLDEDGLVDNTIVFFYGDHGRGLPRAKRWIYDSGTQVPLIIRWPGHIDPGTVREDLVSFIDFAPTLLSVAGVAVPSYMQGRAFLGAQTGPEPEFLFAARDRMDETYDIIRAVRSRRYKYIRNFQWEKPYAQPIAYMDLMPTLQTWRALAAEDKLIGPQKLFMAPIKPKEEFYDLDADPHEIRNLASVPEFSGTLARMRGVLEEWMADTGDLGLIPEDELNERMRPGGKWAHTAPAECVPPGGTHAGPVEAMLTCATEGASIVYTTGTGEGAAWRLYSGPMTLNPPVTLRVQAGRIGYVDSPEVAYDFQSGGA